MKRWACLLAAGLLGSLFRGLAVCGAQTYEAKWESLDERPTPQWWGDSRRRRDPEQDRRRPPGRPRAAADSPPGPRQRRGLPQHLDRPAGLMMDD